MPRIIWLYSTGETFEQKFTQKEKDEAYEWLEVIRTWPECCPIRRHRGRYRNHR